ncbi:MAG: glycoside hydrolase family 3 protein, partial [Chloroflexota bacterium]
MTQHVTDQIGRRLMLAFDGLEPPPRILNWIKERQPAGFTLFRAKNVTDPAQLQALTNTLQSTAAEIGQGPLLIAADQEGGQFIALGEGTTQFPGNMALGATGDSGLARQVGQAMGREMVALGVNVNYAPDCDVNTNPNNPNVGIRAFGDDPDLVATMGAAMIEGLQSAGVAATAKHFPGNGDSAVDPHFGVPVLAHDLERLESVEFRPFRAAVEAGVRLLMTAHVGLPALTGQADLPATLSKQVMKEHLRDRLGYQGLLITDALDMEAITQGAGQIVDVIAALRASVDLLLLSSGAEEQERIYAGLALAHARGLLRDRDLTQSNRRLMALKDWLVSQEQPDLDVVGCQEHKRLAETVAQRSITLVREEAGLLPLELKPEARIVAIVPQPADLTPADTSSYQEPALASALRRYHPGVVEIVVPQRPSPADIGAIRAQAAAGELLVIGSTSAHLQPEQAEMIRELLALDIPAITVAMRTPYDLTVYPQSKTHICTYSIQPLSLRAMAAALWGEI